MNELGCLNDKLIGYATRSFVTLTLTLAAITALRS